MTQTLEKNEVALAEDIGNIVSLEHVNTQVPDQSLATLFYIIGLGFTRDPYMNVGLTNMWINIGAQQFHLPTGQPAGAARPHGAGSAGAATDCGSASRGSRGSSLATAFAWSDAEDHVTVTSPWGNMYRCYAPGAFGEMRLGVPYVELTTPRGAQIRSRGSTRQCLVRLDGLRTARRMSRLARGRRWCSARPTQCQTMTGTTSRFTSRTSRRRSSGCRSATW